MSSEPLHTDDHEDFDIKKLAPTLGSIEKRELFSAPDDYFDHLAGRIHDQVRVPQPEPFTLKSIFNRIFSREGVAALAMCVLLIMTGVWMFQGNASPDFEITERFAELSSEELLAGIDVAEVSEDELWAVFGNEALNVLEDDVYQSLETSETAAEPDAEQMDLSDIDTDDLWDYYF